MDESDGVTEAGERQPESMELAIAPSSPQLQQEKTRSELPHPNKYFLTPMFAHPDDHVLFSRKHWRAETAGGNSERVAPLATRPIGGSAGSPTTTRREDDMWTENNGPTFEPMDALLDPDEFGYLGQAGRMGSPDNYENFGVAEKAGAEEEDNEDPPQLSLRSGLLLRTGMCLVRCVLYLSGTTSVEINGMSTADTSGQTASQKFPPGMTLSGALSAARDLNRNSHKSDSHSRVLMDVLEKARRMWFR